MHTTDSETGTPERDKAGAGWVIAAYFVAAIAALLAQTYGFIYGALADDVSSGYMAAYTIFVVGGVPALLFVGRSSDRFGIAIVLVFGGFTSAAMIVNIDSTWVWILRFSFAAALTCAAAAWLSLRCNRLRSMLWAPLVFPLSLAVSLALPQITSWIDVPMLVIGVGNALPVVVVCVAAAIGDGAARRNTETPPSSVGAAAKQATLFIPTIEAFVEGGQNADEFETAYLALWNRMKNGLERDVSRIVDELFLDVDEYVAEDRLRGDGDIDAAQLHIRAAAALRQLRLLGPRAQPR